MSNILKVTAEDTEELLNAGAFGAGAVVRIQWSATQAGAYADVSGTGATPTLALVNGVRVYTGYDPVGTSGTFYRTRYENAGATRLSPWTEPFQINSPSMLCDDGQIKARLFPAGPTSDTTDDDLINEIIAQVSSWVEGYTGRRFTPFSGTYVLDTSSGYTLRVPKGVRAVTSLGTATLSNQPDTGGTYTTLSAATIMLRPSSMDLPIGWPATEIRLSRSTTSVFATVENGATITGDFGWAATPQDIQAVTIDAVVAAYQNRKNGASGVLGADGDAIVPWSQFFGRGSPQRGTLDRYRYIGIG